MTDGKRPIAGTGNGAGRGVAAFGTLASFGALLSAASCCVLPFVLAGAGVGIGGLAALVPYHWPLTALAVLAVAAGWLIHFKRQTGRDTTRPAAPVKKGVRLMLAVATLFVTLSILWPLFFERPLMRLLGGA